MKYVKKILPFYKDERGEMSHLLDKEVNITSALYVTSKKGSIRANHFHKKDTHYVYLIEGKMEYSYKENNANKKSVLKKVIVNEGEVVKTPPGISHAMKFLKNSIFIALTTEPRSRKQYESDTVKVKLV